LINPFDARHPGVSVHKYGRFQPLSLGIIAALTPDHWEVEILDEKWKPFTFRDADLVGVTAFTSTAPRAYQLAAVYREKGIPVVMGGIHPQMCREEALQRVDTVVLGEAEHVWHQVIDDFEKGTLQRVYEGGIADLSQIPFPRRDLFYPGHILASVQTARGCPLDCEFCSVHIFNSRKHRLRPLEHVLQELEAIPQKLIFFTDDNLVGHSKQSLRRTIELFKGMVERKLNKWWFCQSSMNFGDDEELLYWARLSGCKLVFLGIESMESDGLAEVNKFLNLERVTRYSETFRKINRAGIAVLGSFIFGLDSDNEDKLKLREEYIVNGNLDVIQSTIMTPFPGTRLFQRLEKEDRLLCTDFPEDWSLYDLSNVVFRPREMTPEALAFAMKRCHKRLITIPHLLRKASKTLVRTRSFIAALGAFQFNMVARKIAKNMYRN
jgi:radical SAM superfamily enzyme YgiQ (UPF0313 family)